MQFSSTAALKIVKMTTSSAASNENFYQNDISFSVQKLLHLKSTVHPYLARTAATVDNNTE